ncbi:MAG: dihydroorotase family protein [Actinobacteria bacterium]|nr:dihydroorotase family protein [Actinomycetota bacterium]
MFDLGIEGGVLVTTQSRRHSNVYVTDGKVGAVTSERHDASETVDASGLLVMPGMVDSHVHFMDPADPTREDFLTGSSAAAASGVTTVVEHTHGSPVRTVADLEEKRRYLWNRSHVDFGLAAHAWPDHIDHVEDLWKAGTTFMKVFTCTTHGVPGFDHANLRKLFEQTSRIGIPCLVHCEDETITAAAEEALRASGLSGGGVVPVWRNRDAEVVAVAGATLLATRHQARMVVAHVSHPAALQIVEFARSLGGQIGAETCPQYLSLFEAEVLDQGAFRKFTPPARAHSQADLDEMWTAVRRRAITHISTDHAPSTAEQKGGGIWDAPFGLPGIDTTFSVLLNAAHEGRLGYEDVVRAYSETPARTYGFFPQKGTLLPGSDADIVLVDPTLEWIVSDDDILSRAGWSPLSGKRLVGRAVRTYLRGQLIATDHKVVDDPGIGVFLPGPGAADKTGT